MKYLKIALVLSLILLISACSKAEEPIKDSATNTDTDIKEPLKLTLRELADYDGKDGRPAYIAVDGIIYDVSDSKPWKDGGHNGFEAGKDLTEPLHNTSPHGPVKLDNVPIIGELIPDESSVETPEPITSLTDSDAETEESAVAATDAESNEPLMLTLAELAEFDGKDGRLAYIAVDGIIYDVSNAAPWKGGGHNGFEAGKDLTEPLNNTSPHGPSKLNNVPKIGELIVTEVVETTTKKEAIVTTQPPETNEAPKPVAEAESTPPDEVVTVAEPEAAPAKDSTAIVNEPIDSDGDGLPEFTKKQLLYYNGMDGKPAYFAYKNIVYDVSHIGDWAGGEHNGNYAGYDLTDDLAYASHGEEKLAKAIIVGELATP